MRKLFAGLGLLVALCALAGPAFADTYTATIPDFLMPTPTPAGSTAKCRVFLDGVAVSIPDRACGVAAALTLTLPNESAHAVTFKTVDAAGVLSPAASPAWSLTAKNDPPPSPTKPPTGTVSDCVNITNGAFKCTVTFTP